MADTLALAALVRKRAELAGEVGTLEGRLAQARADLVHLDAVLRLLDPDLRPDAIPPKGQRQRDGWFSSGELPRTILDILRDAPEPLTVGEVAAAVMERRGFDPGDRTTAWTVERRVERSLKRRAAVVERVALGGRAVRWRIRG